MDHRDIPGPDHDGMPDPGELLDLPSDEFASESIDDVGSKRVTDVPWNVLELFESEAILDSPPHELLPTVSAPEIARDNLLSARPRRSRTRIVSIVGAGAIAATIAIAMTVPWQHEVNQQARVQTPGAPVISSPRNPEAVATAPNVSAAAAAPATPAGAGPRRRTRGSELMPVLMIRRSDAVKAPPYSPSFGVNGQSIFFHAGRTGTTSLMKATLAADGSVADLTTVLRDGSTNYHIQESPDQSQIAFDSDRDGERGVYVAESDGSQARRVSGSGYAAVPRWSPDGTHIVFVRAEPRRPKLWNLWIADLTTGTVRRLTSHPSGQSWPGSWFPDGIRLAYSYEDRLVVLDTVTGDERVYPSPVRHRLVRTPAVSPDGHRIVFQVYRDGTWELTLANGSVRRILDDKSAEEFAWTPDGAALAYHSHRSGEWSIWRMTDPS